MRREKQRRNTRSQIPTDLKPQYAYWFSTYFDKWIDDQHGLERIERNIANLRRTDPQYFKEAQR